MFLTCIPEMPSCDLCRDTDQLYRGLHWFSSVPSGKCQDTTKLVHDHFPPYPFQSNINYHPVLEAVRSELVKVTLSKLYSVMHVCCICFSFHPSILHVPIHPKFLNFINLFIFGEQYRLQSSSFHGFLSKNYIMLRIHTAGLKYREDYILKAS